MQQFIVNYLYSMRLYYSFVTLTAGWVGVALYDDNISVARKIVTLTIMFVGWGVNQIVNDYMGRDEDRINAPARPMVSGKLAPAPALLVSGTVIAAAVAYCAIVRPVAMVPILAGVALNIIYSRMKRYGVLGNLFFGLSISCCAWFGYVAVGGGLLEFFAQHARTWFAVVALNMLMTSFTYFKDFAGDSAQGIRTIVVAWRTRRAARVLFVCSFLPLVLMLIAAPLPNPAYTFFAVLSGLLFVFTGFRFLKHHAGDAAYFNLKYNFAALAGTQATLVARTYPAEGATLCATSVILVLAIFTWGYQHADK